MYRNNFEKRIARQLKRAKVSFSYEGQRIPYVIASHYVTDFILCTEKGKIYIECKGYLRPEDKRKLVAVRKQHPEIDLRILFYSLNKRYIKWAEKNGIKYAISKIPKEWLDGM